MISHTKKILWKKLVALEKKIIASDTLLIATKLYLREGEKIEHNISQKKKNCNTKSYHYVIPFRNKRHPNNLGILILDRDKEWHTRQSLIPHRALVW